MKILILCTKLPWPPRDGGAIATLNLAVGTAERGAEVTLLAMNTSKHFFPPEKIPQSIRDLVSIRTVNVDTRIRPLKLILNYLFSSYPYIARRFISVPFSRELQKCLQEKTYDIIQMEGPYLEWYTRFISGNSLLSLRAHNLEHQIWNMRAGEEANALKRMYFRSLARRIRNLEMGLLGRINMLVPISGPDAVAFSLMKPRLPMEVCPAGLQTEKYEPPTDTHRHAAQAGISLFFIGALDWAPNREGLQWFFNHVWPAIQKNWPEMTLHIAGRNPGASFNTAAYANVILEGEVDNALEFFHSHDVMLVPLLSGSGIRVKILEAMAAGKTVISSSVAAAGLDVSNGKHLFIADSAGEYISILTSLFLQPAKMKETGRNARQFVKENFDNLVIAGKLISFYKEQLA